MPSLFILVAAMGKCKQINNPNLRYVMSSQLFMREITWFRWCLASYLKLSMDWTPHLYVWVSAIILSVRMDRTTTRYFKGPGSSALVQPWCLPKQLPVCISGYTSTPPNQGSHKSLHKNVKYVSVKHIHCWLLSIWGQRICMLRKELYSSPHPPVLCQIWWAS